MRGRGWDGGQVLKLLLCQFTEVSVVHTCRGWGEGQKGEDKREPWGKGR